MSGARCRDIIFITYKRKSRASARLFRSLSCGWCYSACSGCSAVCVFRRASRGSLEGRGRGLGLCSTAGGLLVSKARPESRSRVSVCMRTGTAFFGAKRGSFGARFGVPFWAPDSAVSDCLESCVSDWAFGASRCSVWACVSTAGLDAGFGASQPWACLGLVALSPPGPSVWVPPGAGGCGGGAGLGGGVWVWAVGDGGGGLVGGHGTH